MTLIVIVVVALLAAAMVVAAGGLDRGRRSVRRTHVVRDAAPVERTVVRERTVETDRDPLM